MQASVRDEGRKYNDLGLLFLLVVLRSSRLLHRRFQYYGHSKWADWFEHCPVNRTMTIQRHIEAPEPLSICFSRYRVRLVSICELLAVSDERLGNTVASELSDVCWFGWQRFRRRIEHGREIASGEL